MPLEDSEIPSGPLCKVVLALLAPEPAWEPELIEALSAAFGPVDYRGPFHPFEDGGYYDAEMGAGLHRGWLSFRDLRGPGELAAWKHRTRSLETQWSAGGKRSRNLDVGYLDPDKLVLASFKPGPRKLTSKEGSGRTWF